MRRQLNSEELDELYRHVGRCILHLQYLEDVLHTFLTMKIEIREPGRVSVEEANELLSKHRRANLGTALGTASKRNALPPDLLEKLRSLKEERDWLVHRLMHQNGDTLYTDEGRNAVFGRLGSLMQNTRHLKKLLSAEAESFCAGHGLSSEQAEALASAKIARLKGDA
jgi:hypothetical protein